MNPIAKLDHDEGDRHGSSSSLKLLTQIFSPESLLNNRPLLICHDDGSENKDRDGGTELTLAWLYQASYRIALRLNWYFEESKEENASVGILLATDATTVGTVVAMLASVRLGVPFILLNVSAESPDILFETCRKGGCKVIVHNNMNQLHSEFVALLKDHGVVGFYNIHDDDLEDQIDDDDLILQSHEDDAPLLLSTTRRPSAVLYLMSTSGSGGRSKLVQGTVDGAWNRIQWQLKHFPFDDSQHEMTLARTSTSFVDCIAEIFVPLAAGIPLVLLADPTEKNVAMRSFQKSIWRDPTVVLDACRKHRVTRLIATPTFLQELLRNGKLCDSIRYLHSSGEPLSYGLASKIHQEYPSITLVNIYGTTEVGADVAYSIVELSKETTAGPTTVSVGKPLPGCGILLLSENKKDEVMIEGDEGEVFVTGCQVAKGYLGQQEASYSRFAWATPIGSKRWKISSEPCNQNSIWSFRTGDLGRRQNDDLFILGRTDQVVKIRGQKVSIHEI